MDVIKKEITKEEYNRMKELSRGELNEEIEKTLSNAIIYGYGYYGSRLVEDNNKYFVNISIGSSCE